MRCPICGSNKFGDFRGRVNARCHGCGSFERSRLLWLVLEALKVSEIALPFFHFAPEIGIANKLAKKLGSQYRPFDFNPDLYKKGGVDAEKFDLCIDIQKVTKESVGVVCHVHVLEHVRCNAGFVLQELNQLLAPGGYHIFGVPFFSIRFRENLSEELSVTDRLEQFGHEDHVRSFGTQDFKLMFSPAFKGLEQVSLFDLIDSSAFVEANIPSRSLVENSTHAIMVWRKCS